MNLHPSLLATISAIALCFAGLTTAQDSPPATPPAGEMSPAEAEYNKVMSSIQWQTEGKGDISGIATLTIPPAYIFTGKPGTMKMMELLGNLTSGNEGAYLAPADQSWFAVFEFDDIGYVKDDEKDKLDADAILKSLKEGQEAANKELARRGMDTLEVLGWKTPPFYNPSTNNLEWAIRLRSSSGGESLNYKTKLLGRKGVMDVVLVCDEKQLDTVLPQFQELLNGYSFNSGHTYGEYTKGDKIAKYGLTGLILGGAVLAAAKSGLLGKLIKPLIAGLVIVGAFFKRIFRGKSAA